MPPVMPLARSAGLLVARQIASVGPSNANPNGTGASSPTKIAAILCAIVGFIAAVGLVLGVRYMIYRKRLKQEEIRKKKGKMPETDEDEDGGGHVYMVSNRVGDFPSPLETTKAIAEAYANSVKEEEERELEEQRALANATVGERILQKIGIRKSVSRSLDMNAIAAGETGSNHNRNSVNNRSSINRILPPRPDDVSSSASSISSVVLDINDPDAAAARRNRSRSNSSRRNPRRSNGTLDRRVSANSRPSSTSRSRSRPHSTHSTTSAGNASDRAALSPPSPQSPPSVLRKALHLLVKGTLPPDMSQQQQKKRKEQPPLASLPPRNSGGSSSWAPPAPRGARFPVTIPHVPEQPKPRAIEVVEARGRSREGKAASGKRRARRDDDEAYGTGSGTNGASTSSAAQQQDDDTRSGSLTSRTSAGDDDTAATHTHTHPTDETPEEEELPLRVGDAVIVYEWREDGWCFGRREDGEDGSLSLPEHERGLRDGWFPIVCVMPKSKKIRAKLEGVSADRARLWVAEQAEKGIKVAGGTEDESSVFD
ncbi:hypothetical protein HK101_002497 [Irineochytrium annulatum]|nr:hypothetical protein HK101_002497 [Irineochytrium annulatum]